jgi:hypothetical protein
MSKKSTQSQVLLEANRFHVDKLQLFPFSICLVLCIVEPEASPLDSISSRS